MTTSIIDASLHTSSFPATYTGPGTLIGNPLQTGSQDTELYGYFTSNGNAVQINCGFQPLKVELTDVTDVILWTWQYGMPATDSVKVVTAGTTTVDTTSAIVVSTDVAGDCTVTISAAAASTAKLILYHISG